MGFLDSLIKSTIRKTVNDVVGKAVDQAFDSVSKPNSTVAQSYTPTQPQVCTITKPNLSGKIEETDCFYCGEEVDSIFTYELPEKLYCYDSHALEIPIAYMVAHSEDDYTNNSDDLYGKLPLIYFCDDGEFDNNLKQCKNVVCQKVEGHTLIEAKYEYYNPRADNSHEIAYKFYTSQEEKDRNIPIILAITYSSRVDKDLLPYAIQAFELIASTLTKKIN